jgi:hypothetical protein
VSRPKTVIKQDLLISSHFTYILAGWEINLSLFQPSFARAEHELGKSVVYAII